MPGTDMRLSRRGALKGLVGLGVGAFTGTSAWGYLYERHQLTLTSVDLPVRTLPAALRGLRIALLTDTHLSPVVSASLIRDAVRLAMEARPDIIVLGGDYVTWGDRDFVAPAADALSGLEAPHGVFAILGNHDDDRDMPAALTRKGYRVLRDARASLHIRGEAVDLIGLRFWTRRRDDVARVVRGGCGWPILLAHDPRRLSDAAALEVPLVLSGHTHGGQVVLPIVGPLGTRKFPIAAGVRRMDGTTLFVSRGIGTVYVPIRVNCPPEVVVMTLTEPTDHRPRPTTPA